jgi:predicted molibdopterin-dependent oxidoreductase YjgC
LRARRTLLVEHSMNTESTERVKISVDGTDAIVRAGTSVAAAVLSVGVERFRRSVTGEARSALCGMGICFECRVMIDGKAHARSCQIICNDGMVVRTDE